MSEKSCPICMVYSLYTNLEEFLYSDQDSDVQTRSGSGSEKLDPDLKSPKQKIKRHCWNDCRIGPVKL